MASHYNKLVHVLMKEMIPALSVDIGTIFTRTQLYVSWIKKNQAEDNQNVRGIIVARTISEDLKLACSDINDLELFKYHISINLNETPTY